MDKQRFRRMFLLSLIFILIVFLAIWILPVSLPIILAFVTALSLGPAIRLLQVTLKIQRLFSVTIVFVIFLCLLGFGGYFLTSKVISEGISLIENSPQYVNDLKLMWDKTEENISSGLDAFPPEFVNEINKQVNSFLDNTRKKLIELDYFGYLKTFVTKIPNFFVSFLVYLIALFLFMLEMPRLKTKTFSHLTEETAEKVNFMSSRLSYVFIGFLKGQVLVSIIIFVVSLVGLYLIVPDVAIFMSIVIWIVDLVPIIGSVIILAPWSIYKFIIGDTVIGTQLAVLALILLGVRRIVEPKVMGNQIGLSPLPTLISMYLGLRLLGITGLLIGPLVVILFISAREAGIIKLNFKI